MLLWDGIFDGSPNMKKTASQTASSVLPEKSHVVIIGGGPGGTACALALDRMAAESGRQVHITLLEGKQFKGERHYNQCVGVLSPPIPELLEQDLQIPFPHHLCLMEIDGYVLHSDDDRIELPANHEISIALRRVQFDEYMLDAVIQRGIPIVPARAVDLEFQTDGVIVYTENTSLEADVVVGAFGLDEGTASMFRRTTPYQPPEALNAIVTKYISNPEKGVDFGTYIHAYLPSHPMIEFGGITPKCSHVTINIAGQNVDSALMRSFLNEPEVRDVLTDYEQDATVLTEAPLLFKGRFPRSIAKNYYGDRYVMVGDAAGLVRAFKGKGVTTAVQTGIRAADTIMHHGITASAFSDHYRNDNHEIIADLPYGRVMRLVAIYMSRLGLLDAVIRAGRQSPEIRAALFDAVSAHGLYKDVMKKSLNPRSIQSVLTAMIHPNQRPDSPKAQHLAQEQ
jgi:flavin-dependent dehydrogenase